MSGRVDETNYSQLKEKHLSRQSSLEDWWDSDTTYIAVTSIRKGDIGDITDEVIPILGMPQRTLTRFLKRRSGYRSNSAVEFPHEQAYADLNLEKVYRKHLEKEHVQRKLLEITNRIVSGENITFVCYEEDGKSCHRHILVDTIGKMVERREESKFRLTV